MGAGGGTGVVIGAGGVGGGGGATGGGGGTGILGSTGFTGSGGGVGTAVTTGASVAAGWSGEATSMISEHCLQRIFFPRREAETLVCHWQDGQTTGILEPLEVSGTCPRTMGAAAFFTGLAG